MPRDRKKDQQKYYAKPEVKQYHRKWIRAYWKKIKSDPLALEKWRAAGVVNAKASRDKKKQAEKLEWKKMMGSEKSRLAMFFVLMQMAHGKTKLPLTESEKKAREWDRARKKQIRSTPEGAAKMEEIRNRHHDKGKVTRRESLKYKKLVSPAFRLVTALRGRLHSALRLASSKKSDRSMKLFGCGSGEELKTIIESKFKPGMSWKNYGTEWQVDHERPCASFDLSIPEEQSKCFHYSNLRPEWKPENRKKSSHWNGSRWLYSDHRKEPVA